MERPNATQAIEESQSCAERLSRFFPRTLALRLPVQVTAIRAGTGRLREATMVEFGGPEYAIFLSTLPLEFADLVKVEGKGKGCSAEANVVAVQHHEGRKAVAVRFLHGRCDWVTPA